MKDYKFEDLRKDDSIWEGVNKSKKSKKKIVKEAFGFGDVTDIGDLKRELDPYAFKKMLLFAKQNGVSGMYAEELVEITIKLFEFLVAEGYSPKAKTVFKRMVDIIYNKLS